MSFEENMNRLNEIVRLLENDKLSLDKALDYYKEGIGLSVECQKTIENAKLTVRAMNGAVENEQG
ncbi:MAG: exodeoxyribonuclease VII small subunit [Ruminococcus sp.]|nr:exodeoxyribonuclease VII small subunit [Ruminococcus sp.]